ncbi:hypothetical protein DFH27DRAFT_649852 [Peziza echinospora]|nr:hypothetical protein DFH27DRAFT_649852 [Peziza echinospora]
MRGVAHVGSVNSNPNTISGKGDIDIDIEHPIPIAADTGAITVPDLYGPAQPRAGSESPVQPQSTTGGTTGTGTGTDPPPKLPAKFLVYYAGKRTLPLALIKLSTLFLFTTGILLVSISVAGGALTSPSPSSSSSADDGEESTSEPTPPTPLIALSTPTSLLLFLAFSTLPFLFLNHISPPYTTHIYLHLPPWARASPSHLASYIRKLPPSAQLDIVTMAWSGRPRISGGVRLGELEWLGEGQTRKFGCGNMVWRDTLGAGKDRGKGRERGLFYVDPSGRLARTPLGGEVRAGEGVVARVRELTREREVGTQQGGKGV